MKDTLLQTLTKQHVELKRNLESILIILKGSAFNAKKILEHLKKFEKNLIDHLELENNSFYVQLLEKMEKNNMDIENTKEFIDEMKIIEKVVVEFLEQYSNVDAIENNKSKFKINITEIKEQLVIRTDTEEDGVYMYWEALAS